MTPPPPSEDETDATLWIIAIALALAAIVIGAGAMVYRLRFTSTDEPDDLPPGDAIPEDDGGEGSDEPKDDDYEKLTIDMPRREE